MCNRLLRKAWTMLWVVLLCAAAIQTARGAAEWRWQNVARVVALGTLHGDFDRLVGLLEHTGIIDVNLRWNGGDTHLVFLGDLVGGGAQSDRTLELLMRLQGEAANGGGRVHVLLGERELTRMADALGASAPAAYGPEGRYGGWLLEQPVLILINDTAFVHGGLSRTLHRIGGETLNSEAAARLRAYLSLWHRLREYGNAPNEAPFERGPAAALEALERASGNGQYASELKELAVLSEAPVLAWDGPLWYPGTAVCHPLTEWDVAVRALKHLGANRVVLGHSRGASAEALTRVGGQVIVLGSHASNGSPARDATALVLEDGEVWLLPADGRAAALLRPEPRRVGIRPAGLNADSLEAFLLSAPVVEIESVDTGVTRPLRVTLEADGIRIKGLFKTLATDIQSGSGTRGDRLINRSDRYHYEVAAYRLDRLLGLDLVPVTVLRKIDTGEGSLAFWVEDLISVLDMNQQGIEYAGECDRNEQYGLMSVFDALIYNEDRTQQNTVFTRTAWRLRLIDHSRAFRTHRRRFPSYLEDPQWPDPVLSSELVRRLRGLDYTTLHEALGTLLTRQQIRAILARRDLILRTWAPNEGEEK